MRAGESVNIAVIDTETNFEDRVMSVGVVIADAETFELQDRLYILIEPEYRKPAMYSSEIWDERAHVDAVVSRFEAVAMVRRLLEEYDAGAIFAYNALFDCSHLPELRDFGWYDIMKLAANRNYNRAIPSWCPCYSTGRMKSGYSEERMYRMLSGGSYREVHNALTDAEDELEIMRLLGLGIESYEFARIR